MPSYNFSNSFVNKKARSYIQKVTKPTDKVLKCLESKVFDVACLKSLPAKNYKLLNWNDYILNRKNSFHIEDRHSSSTTIQKKQRRNLDYIPLNVDELKEKYQGCRPINFHIIPNVKDMECYQEELCRKNKLISSIGYDNITLAFSKFSIIAENQFTTIENAFKEKMEKRRVLDEVRRTKLLSRTDRLQIEPEERISMLFRDHVSSLILPKREKPSLYKPSASLSTIKKRKRDKIEKKEEYLQDIFNDSERDLRIADLLPIENISLLRRRRRTDTYSFH